jgi:hypothetical protein
MLPFLFTACREDDGPSDCETFRNTKGEIQLWQPAGRKETILVQAESNNVIAATSIIFKLNKDYDNVRWLINNDSNYTYTTKEVTLRFNNPLRTYTVSAIGTKYFSSKECGTIKLMDTLNSSFRTFRPISTIGILGKKFEVESTQYPGEKWIFYFQNTNGPINDYLDAFGGENGPAKSFTDRTDAGIDPPYLIAVNFPRFENDSFRIRGMTTDGYTYFEASVNYWSPIEVVDNTLGRKTNIKLDLNLNNNEVSGEYYSFYIDSLSGRLTSKLEIFKGKAK